MCSNQEERKHINIYLNDTEKVDLKTSKNDNVSQSYIIQSHDKMCKEYALMKQELAELQSEKNALEEDNERLEKGMTNLRGFVKNLSIMKRLNEELARKYAKFQNETSIILVDQYNLVYELVFGMCMELLLITFMGIFLWYFRFISISNLVFTIIIKGSIVFYMYIIYRNKISHIKNIRKIPDIKDTLYHMIKQKYVNSIKEKFDEIKEIENGNSFLSDTMNELIELQ